MRICGYKEEQTAPILKRGLQASHVKKYGVLFHLFCNVDLFELKINKAQ